MSRVSHRLNALSVTRCTVPGVYADGAGLYLQVTTRSARSWIFRFSVDSRAREMGLGSLLAVSLADARAKAAQCRKLLSDGIDPIERRKAGRAQRTVEALKTTTFSAAATAYIESLKGGWRSAKYADQWTTTIATYVEPVFGELPIKNIDTELVMRALEPLWKTTSATASHLRGRIEAILDWATVRGYREGDNPARWRGHLDKLLPSPAKMHTVVHRAALPYSGLPAFMSTLRRRHGVAPRALEFTILTAARNGEAIGAEWDEIDGAARIWSLPGSRMKSGRPHRVPLGDRCIEIIEEMREQRALGHALVFAGATGRGSLSNTTLIALLRRMDVGDITVHGFRSTFRDWAAEQTSFAKDVIEMALAHTLPNKVEAAYFRSDHLVKRRLLIEAWDRFCSSA